MIKQFTANMRTTRRSPRPTTVLGPHVQGALGHCQSVQRGCPVALGAEVLAVQSRDAEGQVE